MDNIVTAENMIMTMIGGGGLIGGVIGIQKGYRLHKQDSYEECAKQTTLYCFKGATVGVAVGGVMYLTAPFLFLVIPPLLCVAVPVAGGSVVAKYIEESTKTP